MALYSIESEQCLGMSHSGAVTVNGESAVELSDEEVDILVKLIKEKETTDVEELNLENLHPTIYKKLDEAYYDMAYKAEEMHWLWEGYYGSYFEYDEDKLKEYCKANCGFSYVFNKEENGYDEDEEVDEYMISPNGLTNTSKDSPTTKSATSSTTTWMLVSTWTMWSTPSKSPRPSSTRQKNSTYPLKCLVV